MQACGKQVSFICLSVSILATLKTTTALPAVSLQCYAPGSILPAWFRSPVPVERMATTSQCKVVLNGPCYPVMMEVFFHFRMTSLISMKMMYISYCGHPWLDSTLLRHENIK